MAAYGYGVSPTMLKTRSRWPSDIVYIYACDMRYYRAAFPRGRRDLRS